MVYKHDKPLGMLEEHSKNSQKSSRVLPTFRVAYQPTCGLLLKIIIP